MEKETLKRLMDANRRGNIAKRKINENVIAIALCITCILLVISDIIYTITK